VFRAKGTNSSGEWSLHQIKISLVKQPKWFQTNTFKILLLLSLLGGFTSFYKWRVYKLKRQKSQLNEEVKKRTIELDRKNIELKGAIEAIEKQSLTDQLTKAHNRHFVSKFLPKELVKFSRSYNADKNIGIGFILLDIDHFKLVNDTYGHDAGDKVLIEFTNVLKEVCRESDWVIRWGGEEFLVIARDIEPNELELLAERMRLAVESYPFELSCEQLIHKTCSIGIVSYPFFNKNVEAISWLQTLNIADVALYAAKRSSRNTWIRLFNQSTEMDNINIEKMMKNISEHLNQGSIKFTASKQIESSAFKIV
jgi:diguanylate cyclase (GGDEF)-like protein